MFKKQGQEVYLRGAKRLLKKKGRRKEKSGREKRKCHLYRESGSEVEKESGEKREKCAKKKLSKNIEKKGRKLGEGSRHSRARPATNSEGISTSLTIKAQATICLVDFVHPLAICGWAGSRVSRGLAQLSAFFLYVFA